MKDSRGFPDGKIFRYTLLTSDFTSCNSLEGVENYSDLDTALVQEVNRWYRFFAASTIAPDGVLVIAPADITPPAASRWIRQGIPALGGNRSQFAGAAVDPCSGAQGAQGAQGAAGSAGAQGNQGAQGAAGAAGAQGNQGNQGAQGAAGVGATCVSVAGVVAGADIAFTIPMAAIVAALPDPDSYAYADFRALLQFDNGEGGASSALQLRPMSLLFASGVLIEVQWTRGVVGAGTANADAWVGSMGVNELSVAETQGDATWDLTSAGANLVITWLGAGTGLDILAGQVELCLGPAQAVATP